MKMRTLRFISGAIASRRLHRLGLLLGESQKDVGGGSYQQGRFECLPNSTPLLDNPVLAISEIWNCRRFGGLNFDGATQFERSGVSYYGTFFQSSVHMAKKSPKGGPEIQNESRKKNTNTTSSKWSPNVKTQQRPIVFECCDCTAMCVKRILKDPYDRGVVIVRCMACGAVNLISDQLGLFKEPGSMHKFLSDRGIDVRNGLERSYELTPENLAELDQLVHGDNKVEAQ